MKRIDIDSDVRKILWVRPDSIGDAVLSASMLKYIKEKWRDSEIYVVCQDRIAELYKESPYVKDIITFNRIQLINDNSYRAFIGESLKKVGFDLCLNSVYSREPLTDFLVLASESPVTIALDGNDANCSESYLACANQRYTYIIKSPGKWKHEIQRHIDFLNGLGIHVTDLEPVVWLSKEDQRQAIEFYRKHGIEPEKALVFFAGAQNECRRFKYWGLALDEFCRKHGLSVVAVGSSDDKKINQINLNALRVPYVNVSGSTSLRMTAAILKLSRLAVGTETGLAHIACAVGVPTVVLLGGGHFGRFMPYKGKLALATLPLECFGCNWYCKLSGYNCVKDVDHTVLFKAMEYAYNGNNSLPVIVSQKITSCTDYLPGIEYESLRSRYEISDYSFEEVQPVEVVFPKNYYQQSPLVSAIVSAYKSEKYLRGCLEDLENQTISDRLEIIVIDSASPQNERMIVEEFRKKYDNIIYVRTSNRETVYGAWNRGVRLARGRYITNANTDDRHRKDAFEVMVGVLEENPDVALVYADCWITRCENETFDKFTNAGQFVWQEFSRSFLANKGCFVGPQPMWRKEIHEKYGFFDSTFVAAGDYEFWMRIAIKEKFKHIPEKLGLYLDAPSSVEHSNQDRGMVEIQIARDRYQKALLEADGKSIADEPIMCDVPDVVEKGRLKKAYKLFADGKYREAWQAGIAAITERPFHPEAIVMLGEISMVAGDLNTARKCAKLALNMAPDFSLAKNLAKTLDEKSNLKSRRIEWATLPSWFENIYDTSAKDHNLSKPRISVCIITRNEEIFIEKCIKSVIPIASEIIVIDTGSTDRTVEIAKGLGAKVDTVRWEDDFSKPRNKCLEYAKGDWVLVIDADEELPESEHEKLIKDVMTKDVIGFRLPLINEGMEKMGSVYVPRLFRNAPGIFFWGKVHENAFESLIVRGNEWGLKIGLGSAVILHHGYDPAILKNREKNERNLRLLISAIQEDQNNPYLLMSLGLELFRAGNKNEGLSYYRKSYQTVSADPKKYSEEFKESLLTQYALNLLSEGFIDEVIRVLTSKLARDFGLTASMHFILASALMKKEDFKEAVNHLKLCIQKRDNPCYSIGLKELRTAEPLHCLANCLALTGEMDEAESTFKAALAEEPDSEAVILDYARFLSGCNKQLEALNFLNSKMHLMKDKIPFWELGARIAMSKLGFREFALDWTHEAIKYHPQSHDIVTYYMEALLLNLKIREAWQLFQKSKGIPITPRNIAAIIYCAIAIDEQVPESVLTCIRNGEPSEPSVSSEFIKWHRRFIFLGAEDLVRKVTGSFDRLSKIIPTAGSVLKFASAEVAKM